MASLSEREVYSHIRAAWMAAQVAGRGPAVSNAPRDPVLFALESASEAYGITQQRAREIVVKGDSLGWKSALAGPGFASLMARLSVAAQKQGRMPTPVEIKELIAGKEQSVEELAREMAHSFPGQAFHQAGLALAGRSASLSGEDIGHVVDAYLAVIEEEYECADDASSFARAAGFNATAHQTFLEILQPHGATVVGCLQQRLASPDKKTVALAAMLLGRFSDETSLPDLTGAKLRLGHDWKTVGFIDNAIQQIAKKTKP